MKTVQVLLSELIPDYQVRVATRFLVHAGVLKRARARFNLDSTRGLSTVTMKARRKWDRMTKAGETQA